MAQHFGEVATGRTLEQAVAKLAGRGVQATYRHYTDGRREWVAEAGCSFSPITGKAALSNIPHTGRTGFSQAVASAHSGPVTPLTLLSNQCASCKIIAVAQSSRLLGHCVACGDALPAEAEDDTGIFLTETSSMPKDYNALLAATPAQASKKNGGLPPADTLKNTGLQFLPELDELNLTATASEEDDLFSDLTTLTPDAVVQEFGDEDDTGLACGDCGDGEDCVNGEEDNAFLPDGDGDEDDGEFGADTGLSALPELQDEDVSFATSLEALANPDNYADMDVLDGMACASAGVPSDLRLVFAPGTGRGDATWFAMASGQPVALAAEARMPEGLRPVFASGHFQQLVLDAVASAGLVNGLRACGFAGVTVSVPVKQAINSAVAAAQATAEAEAAKARAEHAELFTQSVSMAAVALNKNFFSERRNPLRAAIIDSCVNSGMSLAAATGVADSAMAVAGTDYAGELLDLTEKFMKDPPELRAAMASAIGSANYVQVAPVEVPQAAKRTSAVASVHAVAHAGDTSALLPVMTPAPQPVYQATASAQGFDALLNILMPVGGQ